MWPVKPSASIKWIKGRGYFNACKIIVFLIYILTLFLANVSGIVFIFKYGTPVLRSENGSNMISSWNFLKVFYRSVL